MINSSGKEIADLEDQIKRLYNKQLLTEAEVEKLCEKVPSFLIFA